MQSPLTSFIVTAMQKASRFLYRDFFELELSQSSKHTMDAFVSKAYSRTEEALINELRKHPKSGSVGSGEPTKNKINFTISAIDGIKNITRAMPFFSISVCAYYVDENDVLTPQCCVIDFPAFGEICYVEKSKGALLVKNASANSSIKLKPSTHAIPQMALLSQEFSNLIECDKRNFGCFSYELIQVAAGKADIMASGEVDQHFKLILELFVGETGVKVLSTNPMVVSNGHCNANS